MRWQADLVECETRLGQLLWAGAHASNEVNQRCRLYCIHAGMQTRGMSFQEYISLCKERLALFLVTQHSIVVHVSFEERPDDLLSKSSQVYSRITGRSKVSQRTVHLAKPVPPLHSVPSLRSCSIPHGLSVLVIVDDEADLDEGSEHNN